MCPRDLGHQFGIWKCTHCTGAYTLGACKLGAYRLGAYRLEPLILDLELHSLIALIARGPTHGGPASCEPTGWGPTGLSH